MFLPPQPPFIKIQTHTIARLLNLHQPALLFSLLTTILSVFKIMKQKGVCSEGVFSKSRYKEANVSCSSGCFLQKPAAHRMLTPHKSIPSHLSLPFPTPSSLITNVLENRMMSGVAVLQTITEPRYDPLSSSASLLQNTTPPAYICKAYMNPI